MEFLNDKLWDGKKLKKEIKEKLLAISRKIVSDLGVDVNVEQILFTGSLACPVWRASSDIDIHIIIKPIGNYGDNIIDEYLKIFSKQFNSYHSVFIKGYRLEINIKLEEKILDSKGIYDILSDTWIQEPTLPSKSVLQDDEVKDMVLDYQDRIDDLINNDSPLEEINSLTKEIKNMRTSGLEEDGEYSNGNLVFKELRHSGFLEKLYNLKREKEDDFLSFESFSGFFNRI